MVEQGKQNSRRIRRVVIIDDEPPFSRLLSEIVNGLGYDVMVSNDPRSGRTYEIRDSDIVFIDVLMPHVSGLQVLEQLARQNVNSAIVLMSGQGERLDEAENFAKERGLYLIGTLEKPFRLADVKLVLDGI